MLPSLFSCYSLVYSLYNSIWFGSYRTNPFLYTFLKSLPFSESRLQLLWGFLRLSASPPPSPILPLASRPWAPVLSMMRRSRGSVWPCGCGCWLLVGVACLLASFDPPSLSLRKFPGSLSPPPHLHSRPRYLSVLAPIHTLVLILVPVLPPVPGALFAPGYHVVGQAPGLAPEAAGYLQAPSPVCRPQR